MLNSIFTVFGAGLLASLSPCVYPLLPITVGFIGSQSRNRKGVAIVSYASGQIATFVALGAFTVLAGETLGFSSESRGVNFAVAMVLLASGVISFRGGLPESVSSLFRGSCGAKSAAQPTQESRSSLIGAFSLGASSALVASPCTSPILAGVLATMASSATLARGLMLMFAYALGFSSLFLALGLGLARMPKSGSWLIYFQKASALLLIAASAYYFKCSIA